MLSTATPEVDSREGQRRINAGALALDVREPDEFAAGHIAGAQLVPLGTLASTYDALPRDQQVVVVCRSGRRSGEATRALLQAGFRDVVNLAGGMIAWQEAGLPVER